MFGTFSSWSGRQGESSLICLEDLETLDLHALSRYPYQGVFLESRSKINLNLWIIWFLLVFCTCRLWYTQIHCFHLIKLLSQYSIICISYHYQYQTLCTICLPNSWLNSLGSHLPTLIQQRLYRYSLDHLSLHIVHVIYWLLVCKSTGCMRQKKGRYS